MFMVKWSVYAADFDVDAFLEGCDIAPDRVWQRGKVSPGHNEPAAVSGCMVLLGEDEPLEECLDALQAFLTENREAIAALHAQGFASMVSCAFTVGGQTGFTRTLCFPPAILALLAADGILLQISAYPSSDDPWEEEGGAEPAGPCGT